MTGARTTDNPSPPPLIRRPRAVYMVLALALAAVFLTLALRGVDFGAMFRTIRHAQPAPLLLVQAVFFCALLTRSIRWRVLLSGRKPVGFAHVFWATSAGYLGNNFLPLRAGEVLRTALIGRAAGIQTSYVLATAVIERVGDTLILLLAIPFFLSRIAGLPAGFEQKLQWITVVLMAGVGILPFALRHSHRLEGLIARLPVPARLHSTITRLMAGF